MIEGFLIFLIFNIMKKLIEVSDVNVHHDVLFFVKVGIFGIDMEVFEV
jgi:hypothetical protein